MSKLLEKLKEKETERAYDVIFWRPNEGDIIEGTVTEMGETITKSGEAEYLHLETSNGKFMIFLNSILQTVIEKEEVEVGDRIAIKFLGYAESKKTKRKYKNYVLVKADGGDDDDPL